MTVVCSKCGKEYEIRTWFYTRAQKRGFSLYCSRECYGSATVASCCGHGKIMGRIDLEDGRVLAIMSSDQFDRVESLKLTPAEIEEGARAFFKGYPFLDDETLERFFRKTHPHHPKETS